MSRKVMQIGYEPERDRLTWDGWDIHCGHGMDVLLPDRLDGGTWRAVSFEYNDEGWYMPGHPDVSPVGLWARERQDYAGVPSRFMRKFVCRLRLNEVSRQ